MAGYIGTKAAVVSSGAERKKVFDITTTTTSLTGCSYTPNQVHVFHNGVRLVDGTDYTATDGSTVTLTTAAQNGDEVVVISYATFQTSDTVSASAGGTFSNAVTVNGLVTANRVGSDGTVINVQKDGSTVGSIGIRNAVAGIYIDSATGADGLLQNAGSESFGWNPAYFYSRNDNARDLGLASLRWKDLYLSGGVYLGGTGSANLLDDYEEGTWTPALNSSGGGGVSLGTGLYTKVGRLVTVSLDTFNIATTGLSAGNLNISGLPFSQDSLNSPALAYLQLAGATTASTGNVILYINTSSTFAYLYKAESTSVAVNNLTLSEVNAAVSLRFNGFYYTTA